jgi:hypothetical protein
MGGQSPIFYGFLRLCGTIIKACKKDNSLFSELPLSMNRLVIIYNFHRFRRYNMPPPYHFVYHVVGKESVNFPYRICCEFIIPPALALIWERASEKEILLHFTISGGVLGKRAVCDNAHCVSINNMPPSPIIIDHFVRQKSVKNIGTVNRNLKIFHSSLGIMFASEKEILLHNLYIRLEPKR